MTNALDSTALTEPDLAKASAQFLQTDVTVWGIVAMACGALAVMSANISAILPAGVLSGVHASRLDGASVSQLRDQILALQVQSLKLDSENQALLTRFSLQEQSSNAVTRRVGSLEVSLPKLIEALPGNSDIDRSVLTSSITPGQSLVYQADGGSVKIRQQPLETAAAVGPGNQAMPAPLAVSVTPDDSQFGVAIGPAVPFTAAPREWQDLSVKLGPLLLGLGPLLADQDNSDDKRILVGPIRQMSDATALCIRLEKISISCLPMPFTGTPL